MALGLPLVRTRRQYLTDRNVFFFWRAIDRAAVPRAPLRWWLPGRVVPPLDRPADWCWGDPGPGGQLPWGGELGHVAAGLGDDHIGGGLGDAGDRGQQVPAGAKGFDHLLDPRGVLGHQGVQLVELP